MHKLTYNRAIVVIPPQDVWPAIQAIRIRHDAKVRRWMPHITLAYPCVPASEFPVVQERLELACRDLPAFEVELADFRTFRHRRGNFTIWLAPKPEAGLGRTSGGRAAGRARRAVCQRPAAGFPTASERRLGPGQAEMLRLVAELQAAWKPVRFVVSVVSSIWRGEPPDDVFQVAATVPLGEATGR